MNTNEEFLYLYAYKQLRDTKFEDFEKIKSFEQRSAKGMIESILLSLTVLKHNEQEDAKERFLSIAKMSGLIFAMLKMQEIEGDVYGHIDLWEGHFEESLKKAKILAMGVKNHDYNSGGIILSDYWILDELSLVNDCWKKALRLKSLLYSDKEPQNESIEDTLFDLINYAIFGYMCVCMKKVKKKIAVTDDEFERDGLDFNI